MLSPQIEWNCSQCQSSIADRRKYCIDCHSMLSWTCVGSGKSGLYTNYYRHRDSCDYCTPELEDERQQEMEQKRVSIQQQFQALDDKQCPWSEWRRTNKSCIQHTGHDVEQIQQLYSMCEESLIRYRSHRKEKHKDDIITPYLSPMNVLVVTLWHLKHYHSEQYISTEINLGRSTVNYFLTEVIDISHSCIYPELISLPVNVANNRTPHGPERHHKLIVDSTFIVIPEPYDSDQHKAYYHLKSPTNYAIKIQIVCDFHHRIVHVSECYHGSAHDITVLRESGLLEHVNDSVQIIADKGYIGEDYIVTPRKKPHGGELTDEDKSFNRDINSAGAAIENINQRLRTYAILGVVYRGAIDDFEK
ncbi:unnamed protein product [Rotaria sordida]|uniref:DDE Tnp4 domain-containing protein n=1 Tax=Rotaria sordida TaxID=392033 RepID=A0A814T7J4_9BILA|nr:unnamed protein product [Rotaria sordida]CAF1446282.1 unnamed protein product [Rotaria sordida]CAF4061265.1 unnamed protein product [Rotaria sordida]CAF4164070.1 unnamed protein product [Rotaria sordida]